jgi:SAM-dependent methyltransferase
MKMPAISLRSTKCAICGTEDHARELYPANFDLDSFNPEVFSARRAPDGIHYRMVQCTKCGLVRADQVADDSALAELYAQSTFDYHAEVDNLSLTYGRYLAQLDAFVTRKGVLLEIGCGNGFFLREALAQGYTDVRGVEPSSAAVEQADESIGPRIVRDVMRPALFEPDTFDAVCLFQVLDHIADPAALLSECCNVLRPGGLVLCLNHDVESISAKLLKDRSPIVDIEHTYLFSPRTMRRVLEKAGFEVKKTGSARNTYSVHYLTRLIPLPSAMKSRLLSLVAKPAFRNVRLTVPLGNLYVIAAKPQSSRMGTMGSSQT